MDEFNQVIVEKINSLSENEKQRLCCLLSQLYGEYKRARSKKKRNRLFGNIASVVEEYCLDIKFGGKNSL